MRFFSDNAAPACPQVMAALADANVLDTAYDGDGWSKALDARVSALFEAPVRAFWLPSGTAANCLALAAMCPPYGGIICHRDAHIQNDECGAPEFFTHGAKLLLAEGEGAKLTEATVRALLASGQRNTTNELNMALFWRRPHSFRQPIGTFMQRFNDVASGVQPITAAA